MQMLQFCGNLVQSFFNTVMPFPEGVKAYPQLLGWVLFWYMWTMLILFANFFIQDRKRAKASKKPSEKKKKN
jgi:elongation of very long chain fatty acids protein 4